MSVNDRVFDDDQPRWVGVTPPDADYLDRVEHIAHWWAMRFADAVIDNNAQWLIDFRRDDYLDAREQLRIARNAHDRMWADVRRGRFAGWLIESTDETLTDS